MLYFFNRKIICIPTWNFVDIILYKTDEMYRKLEGIMLLGSLLKNKSWLELGNS